ncbi:MAG: hypothetical protein HY927_02525 [Elusimicrobia bacterium]|nr:hypothetical protein [Elusimicrobiota bacterium]
MRIVVVGRTKMGDQMVCIGALSIDGRQSLRLLSKDGSNWPSDARFRVGGIWEVELGKPTSVVPPHVEDILVLAHSYIGEHKNLKKTILASPSLWPGQLGDVFDRSLVVSASGRGYVLQGGRIPSRSTGFWVTDRDLSLDATQRKPVYLIPATGRTCSHPTSIAYAGDTAPVNVIRAGTLVRFSLARWWTPEDADETCSPMCFLQLSGWFL